MILCERVCSLHNLFNPINQTEFAIEFVGKGNEFIERRRSEASPLFYGTLSGETQTTLTWEV